MIFSALTQKQLEEIVDKIVDGTVSEISDISESDDGWESDEMETSQSERIGKQEERADIQETISCSQIEGEDSSGDENEDITEDTVGFKSSFKLTPKKEIKWKRRPLVHVPTPEFLGVLRNDSSLAELSNPLDYFMNYIPNDLFQQMSDMTNIYALQKGSVFEPTNVQEVKQLFGLHMAMGCLKFPRRTLYWDNALGIRLFTSTMAKNRFFKLRSHLHLVNNLEIPDNTDNDRLFKVRPIYDSVRKRCLHLDMEKCLSIDEQMVPFKGKLNIKQYIKGKPCPWGVKIFVLCGKSGLCYDFLILSRINNRN